MRSVGDQTKSDNKSEQASSERSEKKEGRNGLHWRANKRTHLSKPTVPVQSRKICIQRWTQIHSISIELILLFMNENGSPSHLLMRMPHARMQRTLSPGTFRPSPTDTIFDSWHSIDERSRVDCPNGEHTQQLPPARKPKCISFD